MPDISYLRETISNFCLRGMQVQDYELRSKIKRFPEQGVLRAGNGCGKFLEQISDKLFEDVINLNSQDLKDLIIHLLAVERSPTFKPRPPSGIYVTKYEQEFFPHLFSHLLSVEYMRREGVIRNTIYGNDSRLTNPENSTILRVVLKLPDEEIRVFSMEPLIEWLNESIKNKCRLKPR